MLFELLPYPMDIVITFLKPSKFYINVDVSSNNQRPVTSTSGKVGGARLRRFMVITLSKCKKKLRERPPYVSSILSSLYSCFFCFQHESRALNNNSSWPDKTFTCIGIHTGMTFCVALGLFKCYVTQ